MFIMVQEYINHGYDQNNLLRSWFIPIPIFKTLTELRKKRKNSIVIREHKIIVRKIEWD